MFLKLLSYDIRAGIFGRLKSFIFPICVYVFAFIDYMLHTRFYVKMGKPPVFGRNLGDALLYIYGGMREYDPTVEIRFVFPALWMLLYLLLAYIVLYYPYRDLEENGQNILVRTGGRGLWWLSKCAWNVLHVSLYFLLGWGVTALGCVIAGVPLTMNITPNVNMLFDMFGTGMRHPEELVLETLLLPLLVMAAACLAQMALSLFIKPIFSYMVMVAMLVASAYYLNPFLLGNYAMPIRSARMIEEGVRFGMGCAICAGIIGVSVAAGLIRFQKYDILSRENG